MGNAMGSGRSKARVMKIDGVTMKLKTPIQASDVVKDYPGFVLLESEAVKHFGIRAKPLEPRQQLNPKKIYFLVELPKFPDEEKKNTNNNITRRVRSGIHMSAKDRLECLMLSRRAVSDLTSGAGESPGQMRVKMRLPQSQVDKLMEESADDGEVAEKIINLYLGKSGIGYSGPLLQPVEEEWMPAGQGGGVRGNNLIKKREKRVSFVPTATEGEIQLDPNSRSQLKNLVAIN